MTASRSSTQPNENHKARDGDDDGDGDDNCVSDGIHGAAHIGTIEEVHPQDPLNSQHQPQPLSYSAPPLSPLALYPPQPFDETEARDAFRRGAIDKAHETSALSWPEHILNHDVHRRRRNNPNKFRQRSNSIAIRSGSVSTRDTTADDENRFLLHSDRSFLSARSTLRKRRNRSYSDLGLAASASASAAAVSAPKFRSSVVLGDESSDYEKDDGKACSDNKDIEMVAAPASFAVETDVKDTKPSEIEIISATTKGEELSSRKMTALIKGIATWEKYYNRHAQLLVSLALFSYMGQFSRYYLEYVFHMTSSDGITEEGGAFFTDLPVNIIGSFLLGLMVSGDGESISVNLPMAALPRHNFFQNWVVTHTGLRTGFCGALTTFASWNTQMVIMMCGTSRETKLGDSQWISALWGYLVGFYAALQSYKFGVDVAFALSRHFNPHLAMEADRIVDKKCIGVMIHRDLPDFERRFLHSIVLDSTRQEEHKNEREKEDENEDWFSQQRAFDESISEDLLKYGSDCFESHYDDHIHHLRAWKETTDGHRNGFRGSMNNNSVKTYVTELYEIEKNLLVEGIEPRQELQKIARDAGWDVGALKKWSSGLAREKHNDDCDGEHSIAETHLEDSYFSSSSSSVAEVVITLVCFLTCTGWLIYGANHYSKIEPISDGNAETIADVVISGYRYQFLSSLISPLGTYCRWYLSLLNGSIQRAKWEWLPIGTFMANMIASSVSALCAGIMLGLDDQSSWTKAILKAIQGGFAGSCSTVSTFCTETNGLLRALPRHFWGYYYGFGSLFCGMVVAIASYMAVLPKAVLE